MRAQTLSLTRLLQPLGLQNQRVRALKNISRAIVGRFDGQVPHKIPELLSLPYVGLYVACAVACFTFRQRVPIVDANVLRVLGRIAGLEPSKELRRSLQVWEIAWGLLPKRSFVLHNYGLLDFSATICRARAPLCGSCPLNSACVYARSVLNVDATARLHGGPNIACTI